MPGRGCQRLHCQAAGCREADVTGACLDAEVTPVAAADIDIELHLLIDAIYLKYHYDFRRYATASIKRRLTAAMSRFKVETFSELQSKVLHDPAMFPALLDYLTVPVSEMFRDPSYYRSLR